MCKISCLPAFSVGKQREAHRVKSGFTNGGKTLKSSGRVAILSSKVREGIGQNCHNRWSKMEVNNG